MEGAVIDSQGGASFLVHLTCSYNRDKMVLMSMSMTVVCDELSLNATDSVMGRETDVSSVAKRLADNIANQFKDELAMQKKP